MARAEIAADGLVITVDSEYRERTLIKALPGSRWSTDTRLWTLPLTWASCVMLRGTFRGTLEIGPVLAEWARDERARRVDPCLMLREKIERDQRGEDDARWFPYQRVAVDFLRIAGSSLLASEPGTGKTAVTIGAARHWLAGGGQMLVVCPASAKENWRREVEMWAPELSAVVVEGSKKKRREIITSGADVVIIGWEALREDSRLAGFGSIALSKCVEHGGLAPVVDEDGKSKKQVCDVHPGPLNEVDWRVVIADECHRAKNAKSKQTRALWAVGDGEKVEHRVGMTGTPIANHPGDLWSVMRFVKPDEYSVKSKWVERFCVAGLSQFGGLEILGLNPQTEKELHSFLDPRMLRHLKTAVLPQLLDKMPPITRYVTMGAKQKKAYEQLRKTMLTELESGILMTTSPLGKSLRLSQFASSYAELVADGSDKLVLSEPSCKIDELITICEELEGQPAVVFAESRQLIELASRRLIGEGITHSLVTGRVTGEPRQRAIDDFQGGRVRLILVTLGAGGEAITLTAAATCIFLQKSWSALKNLQGEDRLHRIGQTKAVQIVNLLTEGTMEDDRMLQLERKADMLEEVVRDREMLRLLLGGKKK